MPENNRKASDAETFGIKLDNISFAYPDTAKDPVFRAFSMKMPAAKVSVILGPSGCGKTTLLNLVSGLLEPGSGYIDAAGRSENDKGRISVLFQEPRLLPWRSVRRNIEIVLNKHLGAVNSRKTAEHYLTLVGLGSFMDYYPAQLSGGMRQRAAIARAFAYPADTILMDEPFQALDLGLKINLTELFTKLWVEDRRTSVFVTHDINEAILLGDEIFVLSSGKPAEILEHITNNDPHSGRTLESETSIEIEKRLYRLLG